MFGISSAFPLLNRFPGPSLPNVLGGHLNGILFIKFIGFVGPETSKHSKQTLCGRLAVQSRSGSLAALFTFVAFKSGVYQFSHRFICFSAKVLVACLPRLLIGGLSRKIEIGGLGSIKGLSARDVALMAAAPYAVMIARDLILGAFVSPAGLRSIDRTRISYGRPIHTIYNTHLKGKSWQDIFEDPHKTKIYLLPTAGSWLKSLVQPKYFAPMLSDQCDLRFLIHASSELDGLIAKPLMYAAKQIGFMPKLTKCTDQPKDYEHLKFIVVSGLCRGISLAVFSFAILPKIAPDLSKKAFAFGATRIAVDLLLGYAVFSQMFKASQAMKDESE